jgi:hypothetical protein
MTDIPHLPNSPEEEIAYAKQQSFIEEWEKDIARQSTQKKHVAKNKSFIDMTLTELNEIIKNED